MAADEKKRKLPFPRSCNHHISSLFRPNFPITMSIIKNIIMVAAMIMALTMAMTMALTTASEAPFYYFKEEGAQSGPGMKIGEEGALG